MPRGTKSSKKRSHATMDEKRLTSSSSSQSIDTDPHSVSSTESNADVTSVMQFIEQIYDMLRLLADVVETQTQEISSQEDYITRLTTTVNFLQNMPGKLPDQELVLEGDVFRTDTVFDLDLPDLDDIETGMRLTYRDEAAIKMEGVYAKIDEIKSLMQPVKGILQDVIDNKAHQSKQAESELVTPHIRDELTVLEEYRKSVPVLRQRLVELASRSAEAALEKKLTSATNKNAVLKKEVSAQHRKIDTLTRSAQEKDQTIAQLQALLETKTAECDRARTNEVTAKNKLLQYHTQSAERLKSIFEQKDCDLKGLQDLLDSKPETPQAKRVAQHALDAAKRETQMQNNLSKQALVIGNLREKVFALECQLATSKGTPMLTAFSTQTPANHTLLKSEVNGTNGHARTKPAMGKN